MFCYLDSRDQVCENLTNRLEFGMLRDFLNYDTNAGTCQNILGVENVQMLSLFSRLT